MVTARAAMVQMRDQFPDLAEVMAERIVELDKQIAMLDSIMDFQGLTQLGFTVVGELKALPKEGLKPRFHPGDVSGG